MSAAFTIIALAFLLINNRTQPQVPQHIEYISNDINDAGFPEAQILPHCKGNAELCGELSAIYHLGQDFPATDNAALDRICQRLTQISGYGRFANLN
ncbi:hypothetical protein [Anabaena sp. PCC 7108]|uniref:hypothetical protein n=1 Tax=Anabaena sp. PCC 7108 TaxID=163908 RepID=UPI0011819512|nr:hypothetical protein [Anabaena sp. PCC 7108]